VFNVANHEITPSKDDIAGWIELSPVNKEKTVDVNVDSGKVLQYINKIAKPYVQPPRSRLITNTENGQVVLDAGANGIDVVQKDKTASDVAKALVDGKGVKSDLEIKYAAAQTVEVQPYDKWFVADVTTKHMYAYEGTNLVKTFLVSAGAPATPTVLGKYAIYTKYRSQDMSGNNADGSRYFQPAVPYVNYFYGGYAIHGNYWRPDSWFGNINSSHGCIGVNVADGAWIYDWASIGTPVIVHS
jgi:lipoprotein-anchoring transpeptidase ErfK/SrfK